MIPNTSPFQPGDKVVAYCRYSEGDDQGLKNTSTEEQEDAIRKFCDANELNLIRVFADPFASGRSVAKRDNYLEMLSFLLHGKKRVAEGVILWDYERYGRNYDRAQYDAAQLRMKGYKLFSMQQPITDNSPFSHVLESMYFASAQNQSDMISADVKRALQSNFTKHGVIPRTNIPNGWIGKPVKLGYLTDGRERIGYRVEPDPELKDKIKEAMLARLDHASLSQMKMILGDKFSNVTILSLMKKPLLYGSMTYGGTTIEDYCDPIIDKDTFDRLQVYNASLPKRKRSPAAGVYSKNRSLLSGLLYCGECGGKMYLDCRKSKGHTYETYYCSGYHIGVRREEIETLVLEKAIEILSGDHWQNDLDLMMRDLEQDIRSDQDIKDAEMKIRQIDRDLKRLVNLLLTTPTPPDVLMEKMRELEAQKKELKEYLSSDFTERLETYRAMANKTHDEILTVLKSKYTSTDEKRDALNLFIESITIERLYKRKLRVRLAHGIPDSSKISPNLGSSFLRPSATLANTSNLRVTEFTISLRQRTSQ